MKSVSGKKLCKIVEKKGWILRKVTGSHHICSKPGENKTLIGTLKALMRIAELTEKDL